MKDILKILENIKEIAEWNKLTCELDSEYIKAYTMSASNENGWYFTRIIFSPLNIHIEGDVGDFVIRGKGLNWFVSNLNPDYLGEKSNLDYYNYDVDYAISRWGLLLVDPDLDDEDISSISSMVDWLNYNYDSNIYEYVDKVVDIFGDIEWANTGYYYDINQLGKLCAIQQEFSRLSKERY